MKETYSINDVAMITGLSTRTIRNYISLGFLSGEKVNGAWSFTDKQIEAPAAPGDKSLSQSADFAHSKGTETVLLQPRGVRLQAAAQVQNRKFVFRRHQTEKDAAPKTVYTVRKSFHYGTVHVVTVAQTLTHRRMTGIKAKLCQIHEFAPHLLC